MLSVNKSKKQRDGKGFQVQAGAKKKTQKTVNSAAIDNPMICLELPRYTWKRIILAAFHGIIESPEEIVESGKLIDSEDKQKVSVHSAWHAGDHYEMAIAELARNLYSAEYVKAAPREHSAEICGEADMYTNVLLATAGKTQLTGLSEGDILQVERPGKKTLPAHFMFYESTTNECGEDQVLITFQYHPRGRPFTCDLDGRVLLEYLPEGPPTSRALNFWAKDHRVKNAV
jgi:hypothetical protein